MNLKERLAAAAAEEVIDPAKEFYDATFEVGRRDLVIYLKAVLDITPETILGLKGPGGSGVAVYTEMGVTFTVWNASLCVARARETTYPARSEWTPVRSLDDLLAFLGKADAP